MKIETKLDVNDTGYFMRNNKIVEVTVNKIIISVEKMLFDK